MNSLRQDIFYAFRRARRAPAFTAVVVLTLALGIGASAAVFTFLDAALLKSLPYASPEQLVALWESSPERGLPQFGVSPANLGDWRARSRAFSGFAASTPRRFILKTEGDPERLVGAAVSINYFAVLGLAPTLGRGFVADDSAASSGRVAVLSQALWRRQFGADPSILGTSITLNGAPHTVVGVMGSGLPGKADIWVPLTVAPELQADRNAHMLSVTARIASGQDPPRAERDLKSIATQLAGEFPASNEKWTVIAVPVLDQVLGKTKPAVIALMVAVLFVLLIACANVANLLLARGMAREGEIAVRTAMGAQRSDLIRQLLVESLVLAVFSGVVGVFIAWLGVSFLRSLAPANLPRLDQVSLDARFVWFIAGIAACTAMLFGLPPALSGSMSAVASRLRGAGRGSAGRGPRGGRLQRTLVITQVAVAILLLSGSALMRCEVPGSTPASR